MGRKVAGEGEALNGDFYTGIVDTGGDLPPVALILVANLAPVPLIPAVNENLEKDVTTGVPLADIGRQLATSVFDTSAVVHLDLRISQRIFKKSSYRCYWYFEGLG